MEEKCSNCKNTDVCVNVHKFLRELVNKGDREQIIESCYSSKKKSLYIRVETYIGFLAGTLRPFGALGIQVFITANQEAFKHWISEGEQGVLTYMDHRYE